MSRKELLLSAGLAISALVAITLAVSAATIQPDSYDVVIAQARTAIAPRLTRAEQERRLARVVDAAIQNRKARVVD